MSPIPIITSCTQYETFPMFAIENSTTIVPSQQQDTSRVNVRYNDYLIELKKCHPKRIARSIINSTRRLLTSELDGLFVGIKRDFTVEGIPLKGSVCKDFLRQLVDASMASLTPQYDSRNIKTHFITVHSDAIENVHNHVVMQIMKHKSVYTVNSTPRMIGTAKTLKMYSHFHTEESALLEFKTFERLTEAGFYKLAMYVNSFINTQGGSLICGINDEGRVIGTEICIHGSRNCEDARQLLVHRLKNILEDDFMPSITPDMWRIRFIPIEDEENRYVIVITIAKGHAPVHFWNIGGEQVSYMRREASIVKMEKELLFQRVLRNTPKFTKKQKPICLERIAARKKCRTT
ncbi:hypothetical protein PCE1_004003 [Barthelona sp. PCE]